MPQGKGRLPLVKGRWSKARKDGRLPYGEDGPEALARQTQAPSENRTTCNFCKSRAQWPGGNLDQSLRFRAPEGLRPPQEVTPVNGGPGGSDISAESRSALTPGGSLVTFCPRRKSLAAWDHVPKEQKLLSRRNKNPAAGRRNAPAKETKPPPGVPPENHLGSKAGGPKGPPAVSFLGDY